MDTDPILSAAPEAVISIDEVGRVVALNPAAEQMFGYSLAEAIDQPVAELVIPPRLRAAQRAGLKRVAGGGPSRILGRWTEHMAMRAGGGEFPVEVAVTRTGEDPLRFTAWIRDLSDRRPVEAEAARRKALFTRAEQLAEIGSWEWRPETDEIIWSDNLYRRFGLEPNELTPTLELVLERTHPDDREQVERNIEAARREGELPPMDLRIVLPDGTLRHLRATGGLEGKEHGGPRRLVGVMQDVTEQRRAEREIAAHLAVSEALSGWASLEQGGERLLRQLGASLDFAVGALWLPQGDVLVPCIFWHTKSIETPEFERATRELRLPMGIGLPGQAWERRRPIDLASVLDEGNFPRHEAAAGDDLRSGVAIPALTGDEVLAVVELYSREQTETTTRFMSLLTGVGYELGAFLACRRGDLKPPPLTVRELEILQLAARGLSGRKIAEQLVISQATVKTHFEHINAKLAVSTRAAAVAQALRDGLIE